MKPKFTRVLSITADNDLRRHMERLSEAERNRAAAAIDTTYGRAGWVDYYRSNADKPKAAQAVEDNLKVTALAGDNVNLPAHYARFKIEPIRFITENGLPFLPGNVIKYTCRYDAKNGIEDLRKARRCLDLMIAHLEGDTDWWKRREA